MAEIWCSAVLELVVSSQQLLGGKAEAGSLYNWELGSGDWRLETETGNCIADQYGHASAAKNAEGRGATTSLVSKPVAPSNI